MVYIKYHSAGMCNGPDDTHVEHFFAPLVVDQRQTKALQADQYVYLHWRLATHLHMSRSKDQRSPIDN